MRRSSRVVEVQVTNDPYGALTSWNDSSHLCTCIQGTIPLELGRLSRLQRLVLELNHFEGTIPTTQGLRGSRKLKPGALSLYVGDGHRAAVEAIEEFHMCLPTDLSSNRLNGHIPSSLGNCRNLIVLDLDDNELSGNIPKQLLELPSLTILLNLSQKQLSGRLPTRLETFGQLDLSYKNLSGNIPSRIGKIPQFLERFSFDFMNLSFNDFDGQVPVIGVFANSSAFSILGNDRLCGGLVELGLRKCKEIKRQKKGPMLFAPPPPVAYAPIAILLNFHLVQVATDGFSKANLIGEGGFSSVYKGILEFDDDIVVAVKVLHLQNRGARRSFMRECEAWSLAIFYSAMICWRMLETLAHFLGTDLNQYSSTGIRGTIGYAPPEYGLGSAMTSSGDVYSFGILLFEVMTGKKPTDNVFNEGLSLHDTEANAQKMEECLASILKIGVSCSVDSPPQRMNIENVVHQLRHILDVLQNIEAPSTLFVTI
ncbi:kinase-like domain-containing protein [Tanacetum coccineum]